jgi:hypothetical protein
MMTILRIVIAIILVGHGLGHIMGFLGTWTSWTPFSEPSFNESPWIFSDGIFIHSAVGKVFGIFWLVAMIGSILVEYRRNYCMHSVFVSRHSMVEYHYTRDYVEKVGSCS